LFLILLTIIRICYSINNINSKYTKNIKCVSGIITNIKKEEDKVILTIKAKENMLIYYYNKLNVNLGDKIKATGKLVLLENNIIFNIFNYKKYMLSKNTYYKMNAENIKIIVKNKNILYKIKNFLINKINKIKRNDYLKLFILGDNSYIDEEVKKSYSTNGISHLFSVSGMHITLLSSLILFILNKIKKTNINYIILILILLIFMFLTNFTPSVIRAVLLFIFLFLNKIFNLNISTFKILIIIVISVLLINPYNIYNIGFLFSYIISIYLILFNKIINKTKNYFIKLFSTSLISFLVSIPILINNFFSINLITILNNIIFVPLVSIVIFPLSLITLLIPQFDFIYEIAIDFLEKLSLFIINFKIEIILKHTNIFILILYFVLITITLIKILNNKNYFIIFIIIVLFIHTNINNIIRKEYINFIDVGQGDCIF